MLKVVFMLNSFQKNVSLSLFQCYNLAMKASSFIKINNHESVNLDDSTHFFRYG